VKHQSTLFDTAAGDRPGAYCATPTRPPRVCCDRCHDVILGPPTVVLLDRSGKPEHRYQTVYLCRDCDEAIAQMLAHPAPAMT
jgi:hypothetical protein